MKSSYSTKLIYTWPFRVSRVKYLKFEMGNRETMRTFTTFQQLKKKLRKRAFEPQNPSEPAESSHVSYNENAMDISASTEYTKNILEVTKEDLCGNGAIQTPRSSCSESTQEHKVGSGQKIAGDHKYINAYESLSLGIDFSRTCDTNSIYIDKKSSHSTDAVYEAEDKNSEAAHSIIHRAESGSKNKRVYMPASSSEPSSKHTHFTCHKDQKMRGFDQTIRVSDNPFDVLENNQFKAVQIPTAEKQDHTSKASDDLFLSVLKKPKKAILKSGLLRKEGIFQRLTIYSRSDLALQTKKYYKFPFETQLLNDGSFIFSSVKNAFVSALSSAYSNYRRFGESFKVLTNEGLFIFEKDVICSRSLMKMINGLDIDFSEIDDRIVINPNDKGLVYDAIMNLEVPKGKPLPFILSEFEFEDGIVYRTKLNKGPVVRNGNIIEYTYYVVGPLYSPDFKVDDDVQIDYVE